MAVTGFEQFAVGQVFHSPPLTVDAEAIMAFATAYDPQPQHLGEAEAAGSIFGTLVASGWHTAALTMRLLLAGVLHELGGRMMGVRMDELTWPAPVKPGAVLHVVTEVLAVRPSRSKPDRGVVVMRSTTEVDGRAVQTMTSTVIVLRSGVPARP